jgi:uncharacterized protein (TIGR00299 family) protein
MRLLYLDCFSGISGDMLLGALLDAGLPIDALRGALGSLALDGYEIAADRVSRAGVAATKFRLIERGAEHAAVATHDHSHHEHSHPHSHGHSHSHSDSSPDQIEARSPNPEPRRGHHPHRSLREIFALIDKSALSVAARERVRELFTRLAEAEAAIHQMSIDTVHLHEVGALDSIIDIVGAVFGLEWIGADEIVCSPLNVGGGMVDSAHGRFPVPAPATVRLLADAPVYSSGQQAELVTPTGALLATSYARRFGPLPAMTVRTVGYGAGDRNPASTPNVLRILCGDAASDTLSDRVVVLEFEIDDMNPQIFGSLMDELYAAGALEVFYAPVQMKKNRPGTLVTIVGRPVDRERLSGIVFRETTTIGLRYHEIQRECLERESRVVETPVGPIRFKVARRDGHTINAAPEFEDCARIARERGLSVKDVQAIATKAFLDAQ